jgi:hypothetical protein
MHHPVKIPPGVSIFDCQPRKTCRPVLPVRTIIGTHVNEAKGAIMSLGTFAQALAEERKAKWLLENYPAKLQIGLVLPVRYIDGQSLQYNSLDDPDGNPIPFGYPLRQCAAYTDQSFDSWQERVFGFGTPATMYQTCEAALDTNTTTLNNVDDVQFAKACRQCMYDGFRLLTVGGVPTLQQFDDAFFRVVDNEGYPNAVMARTGSVKRYLNLRRAAGLEEQYVEIEVPDPRTGKRKALWPSIHGVPFYINDAMEVTPEGENVYFMVMGDNGHHTPGHGLTLIISQVRRGNMFVRRTLPITTGPDSINSTATEAAIWPMGIAYGSAGAISRLADITPL